MVAYITSSFPYETGEKVEVAGKNVEQKFASTGGTKVSALTGDVANFLIQTETS